MRVQSLTEIKPPADCRNAQLKMSAKQTRIPHQERRGVLDDIQAEASFFSEKKLYWKNKDRGTLQNRAMTGKKDERTDTGTASAGVCGTDA